MDESACNYNPEATVDDGSCWYAEIYYDCEGNCLNDIDGDGICDEFIMWGCLDPLACNYDPWVGGDDGSCWYPDLYYDCNGNCLNDVNDNGICDELEIEDFGCTDPNAINYDPFAIWDDCSCMYENYFPLISDECDAGPWQLIILAGSISSLEGGDEIALFDLQGITNFGDCSYELGEVYVGNGWWNCTQEALIACGSQDFCDFGGNQYPGFIEGNPIVLKIYRPSENTVYIALPEFSIGDGLYGGVELETVSEIELIPETEAMGCNDPEAVNYNPIAIYPDDSCLYAGDITLDSVVDILDLVLLVHILVHDISINPAHWSVVDVNEDGIFNILDIVWVVNFIINDG